jgi:type II secretory pathway component PulF
MLKKKQKQHEKKQQKRKVTTLYGIGKERLFIAENLSNLVHAGVSVHDAVLSLAEDVKNKAVQRALKYVAEDIHNGVPAWRALEQSRLFEDHVISLVRIGEETGHLVDNLRVVAEEQEKSQAFASHVRSALMYPVFVLMLTLVIGVGVAWFILPRLTTVFAQLGTDLPVITEYIMALGLFLKEHGFIAVPTFLVSVGVLFFVIFIFSPSKFIGQYIVFHLPGIGVLLRQVEIARFGFLLGTLLQAGFPIARALSSLRVATTFRPYKKLYGYMEESVQDGLSFKNMFAEYAEVQKLLPVGVQRVVISAEQSGTLAEALIKMGSVAEKKTTQMTKNISVMLEPILLVVVWVQDGRGFTTRTATSREVIQSVPTPVLPEDTADTQQTVTDVPRIIITDPGVGYVPVRVMPAIEAVEVGRVYPGEEYAVLAIVDEWYRIETQEESGGWVFGEYTMPADGNETNDRAYEEE